MEFKEETTYLTYTYAYIIGGKEVKSNVDTAYTTYGLPCDVKISYAGDIFVNSNVDPESYTHGIPVDVLVSTPGQSFIQDVAKHLMASAPLIEIDDNGNVKQVGDAKAKLIAGRCVQYATYLNDAVAASEDEDYTKDKATLLIENGNLTKELAETKEKLKEKEKALILSTQYVRDLKKALEKAEQTIPSEPTYPTDDDLKKEWKDNDIDVPTDDEDDDHINPIPQPQ